MKKKTTLFWMLAILITLAAALFQRMTGPTNPKQVRFTLNGNEYRSKMPRSITNTGDFCNFNFTIKNLPDEVVASLFVRKYRSDEEWAQLPAARTGERFSVKLPIAPPAAKMEYYVSLETEKGIARGENIVMRYKDNVPATLLIPHILLMFTAMLLSNLAGLLAFFRRERYMGYAKIAFACLLLGGLVLGCLVQKAAFGHYWTGFPLGNDMTDNKTLFVFLFWLIALIANWKSGKRPVLVGLAAVFMLLVYCIPHSLGGSEYDYQNREVMTGK
jgi:hypothetical protein